MKRILLMLALLGAGTAAAQVTPSAGGSCSAGLCRSARFISTNVVAGRESFVMQDDTEFCLDGTSCNDYLRFYSATGRVRLNISDQGRFEITSSIEGVHAAGGFAAPSVTVDSYGLRIPSDSKVCFDYNGSHASDGCTKELLWDSVDTRFELNGSFFVEGANVFLGVIGSGNTVYMMGNAPVIRAWGADNGWKIIGNSLNDATGRGISVGCQNSVTAVGARCVTFINAGGTEVGGIGIKGELYVDAKEAGIAGDSSSSDTAAGTLIKDTTGNTYTLTNALVTATSPVMYSIETNDANCITMTVAPAAGSVVFTCRNAAGTAAAPTANTTFRYWVLP